MDGPLDGSDVARDRAPQEGPYDDVRDDFYKRVAGYLFFALFVAGVWWLVTVL